MTAPVGTASPMAAAAPADAKPPAAAGSSFHDVLSALNPLQYLPVIGTIYRAVTHDTIPEGVRRIGSVIVSAVTGGPIGVAISLATFAAEKATGIDLDQVGQRLLRGEPTHDKAPATDPPVTVASGTQAPATAGLNEDKADTAIAAPAPSVAAWSPAQLTAYGVTISKAGTLRLADLQGADVLNALELSRIQQASSAYGNAVAMAEDDKFGRSSPPQRPSSPAWYQAAVSVG